MTTTAAKAAILDRIGDCTAHIAQASAEGRRAETALANWQYLFESGQYTKARAWWVSEIQPSFTTESK